MEFCSMTAKEFREYINGKFDPAKRVSESKYHAQKTQLDGITFDSKKEANRYEELRKMEACGLISELKRQVRYNLIPAQQKSNGRKERGIDYIADFVYKDKENNIIVEDVKSPATRTREYLIKRKLMLYFHGIEITEF